MAADILSAEGAQASFDIIIIMRSHDATVF